MGHVMGSRCQVYTTTPTSLVEWYLSLPKGQKWPTANSPAENLTAALDMKPNGTQLTTWRPPGQRAQVCSSGTLCLDAGVRSSRYPPPLGRLKCPR